MSTVDTAPPRPLLPPAQAAKLLDAVVYERVFGCIDLDELYQFEQELWSALAECGFDDTAIPQTTDAMIRTALTRVPEDERRHVQHVMPAEDELAPFGDCALCEDEQRPSTPRRRSGRTGSKQ